MQSHADGFQIDCIILAEKNIINLSIQQRKDKNSF